MKQFDQFPQLRMLSKTSTGLLQFDEDESNAQIPLRCEGRGAEAKAVELDLECEGLRFSAD